MSAKFGVFESRPVFADSLPHGVELIGIYGKIEGKSQLLATSGTANHCASIDTARLFIASPLLYEALEEIASLPYCDSHMAKDIARNALRAARGEEA